MLVLLVISSFSALIVSTTKSCLQLKYDDMHKTISREESEETGKFTTEKLKENVGKYWMMAETGSPQFVMARSMAGSASGAICFLAAGALAPAILRKCFGIYPDTSSKEMGSSYNWSTFPIFIIQSSGVAVGTIAPTFRWFTAIRLRCSEKGVKSYKTELKIENYWIERLVGWKIVIVYCSKLILLISIFFTSLFSSFGHFYKVLKLSLISKHNASNNHTRSESGPGTELEFSRYVLYLEGEEELPLQIMKKNMKSTEHFIQKGEKQRPKYLKELLQKSAAFMGVATFDSDQVPSLDSEEPPNCWSLPVVTLTSIAIALPNIENHKVKQLLQSVSEGLFYVNLVEKFLNTKSDMLNIINAADCVWLGVDLSRKWLDEDLQKMAHEVKNAKESLERLIDTAKTTVIKFKANLNGNQEENPLSWHIKAIAANSLYRIGQTMLLDLEGCNNQTDEGLFDQLSIMIADILGACLTNLPCIITMKSFCSAIEEREKSVRHAAQLLGETEEILKILQQCELPCLNPDKVAYIDEWRTLIKKENPLASLSSFNDGRSSGSSELHVTVE
ncbi:uncharacterized protein LOC132305417 [Cornus florida]|uniref:uncharacterized protein LOC132305417 n=1 Tax=Cornus florida TaxID=4283 RepID=UPI002897EAC7|nr:uncharacterized protein LOC132305417 [Cornus florida]